jgi:diguanylate cyclase
MTPRRLDWSARGWPRVYVLTFVGTLICVAVAFAIDSYSFETGSWHLSDNWFNNIIIPLVLAPPFFFFLLFKLRELAIAHHELMHVAATDSLTSCLNRRAFTAMVDGYLERVTAEESKAGGALLIIDVDHFKVVNDRFGHDRGDEALKLIARTITAAVREIDLVGRIGGEEFSVFLPGMDPARTTLVAERIRMAVSEARFLPAGQPYSLSVSIGGAAFNRHVSFSELDRQADQRLYSAKRGGRNRVEIHPPPTAAEAAVPVTMH